MQQYNKTYSNEELFNILESYNDGTFKHNIDTNICTNCSSHNKIIEDVAEGILVCSNCGMIQNELYDDSQEVRDYGADDMKESVKRCNFMTNIFLPQSSLGTTIACSYKCKTKQLHNWNSMPYRERILNLAFKDIHDIVKKLHILKCVEDDVKILYSTVTKYKYDNKKSRNNNVINTVSNKPIINKNTKKSKLMAACIYMACKKKTQPRNQKEIAKVCNIKIGDIKKGCKEMEKYFKLTGFTYDINNIRPKDFINRFAKYFRLNSDQTTHVLQIAENIQKLYISFVHTPFKIALCSFIIYVNMTNMNITKKAIAVVFDISEATVSKVYDKVSEFNEILFDNNLVKLIGVEMDIYRKTLVPSDAFKKKYESLNSFSYKPREYNVKDIKCINKMITSIYNDTFRNNK